MSDPTVRISREAIEGLLRHHDEIESRFRGREMPYAYMVPTELLDALRQAYNVSPDCDVSVSFLVVNDGAGVTVSTLP